MRMWSFFVCFMMCYSSTIMTMDEMKDENKLPRNTKNLKVRFLTITCYVQNCTNPECLKFKSDNIENSLSSQHNDFLRKSPSLPGFLMNPNK